LLLFGFVVSACTGGFHFPAGSSHELRIADFSDPSSLNPLLAHDQSTIGYDLLICQTLIGLDADNKLTPVLVTRVPSQANGDISRDGKRIAYHLRRGVRFADGKPLTSADVAFTYRAILDSRNPVLSQDAYRRIASLETPDPYTVVILLKKRWNAAVNDLFAQSDFAFGILPAHAFQSTQLLHAAWENHAFGTGPFRVVSWRRGDRVVLDRNPYYTPAPKLARIVLQMVPDANTALVALRSHDVDVAPVYPDRLSTAEHTPGLHVLRTPENATVWLTLQLSAPPANDIAVRRAIASAIDLQTIYRLFHGVYPVAASFLPPVMRPWYDASIPSARFDVVRARALLGGRTLNALLVVQNNGVDIRTATILQEGLARAGIHASVKQFPVTLYNAPDGPIRNARFTITIDGWLGGADPEQSIIFLCSQANVDGDNTGRFCDPQFERLFSDQQTTPLPARRLRDFRAMQELIHDRLPVIPLYYEVYFDGMSDRVHGFARNMLRYPVAPEMWDVR
jgi:peptide/nickel transport system substrate-binding protein